MCPAVTTNDLDHSIRVIEIALYVAHKGEPARRYYPLYHIILYTYLLIIHTYIYDGVVP